jgi:hypothetical protein
MMRTVSTWPFRRRSNSLLLALVGLDVRANYADCQPCQVEVFDANGVTVGSVHLDHPPHPHPVAPAMSLFEWAEGTFRCLRCGTVVKFGTGDPAGSKAVAEHPCQAVRGSGA